MASVLHRHRPHGPVNSYLIGHTNCIQTDTYDIYIWLETDVHGGKDTFFFVGHFILKRSLFLKNFPIRAGLWPFQNNTGTQDELAFAHLTGQCMLFDAAHHDPVFLVQKEQRVFCLPVGNELQPS